MKYLFDDEGVAVLEQLSTARTLYAFDFDGTLCPIVPSPDQAVLPETISVCLQALSKLAPVTIISGRSLSDLRSRISIGGIQLLGNHGAEGLLSEEAVGIATRICAEWIRALRVSDVACQIGEDFILEDKGISISLHYRHAANRKQTLALLEEKITMLQPKPRVVPGKLVLNLVPDGSPHKGAALLTLLTKGRYDRALFVGDDITDEDIFRLRDERVTGVRITPLDESNATYFLKDQLEIERLLSWLILAKGGNPT